MDNFRLIEQKLEAFIRKYYLNELLRGLIAFVAIGLGYFLLTLGFEYFFWMGQTARSILFWAFVVIESALFLRLIALPLLRLFKLSKGIDYFQASKMIGDHFPEVDDKLLNILQLKNEDAGSDLIIASINQKAKKLKPVPFSIAINFRTSLNYLKYAAIPILVILAIYISGNANFFSDSYERVVNYDREYTPPAPFQFEILNADLTAKEDENFTLQVQINGKVVPSEVKIKYEGKTYFLEQVQPGVFRHEFERRNKDVNFRLQANDLQSNPYELKIIQVPNLVNFEVQLDYPAYTGKKDETIQGTGNASVPEGTKIKWKLRAESTSEIAIQWPDSTYLMKRQDSLFTFSKRMMKSLPYALSTSNKVLKNYEQLDYKIDLVPDENPEINVERKTDSVNQSKNYFFGRISDDYGLRKLELVYQPKDKSKKAKTKTIGISRGNFDEFVSTFPGDLDLEGGLAYEYYFRVWDNDAVNGSKASRSRVFSYRKLTQDEEQEKQLQNQQEAIKGMDKSLEKMRKSKEDLESLDRMQKEKEQLNYNDRRKMKQFLEQQKREQEKMQRYSEKMKRNLEKFKNKEQDSESKEQLQERLERSKKEAERNKKLLDKLKKYEDKIEKDQLGKDLEELKKQSESQRKNLEQMVELTKRFYVEEKAKKLNDKLNELAKKQKELSEKEKGNTSKAQKELNKDFEKFRKEMDSLESENKDLKKPMNLKRNAEKEKSAANDQKAATDALEKKENQNNPKIKNSKKESDSEKKKSDGEQSQGKEKEEGQSQDKKQNGQQSKRNESGGNAKKKQQSAAEKMRQMAAQMQSSLQQGQSNQNAEDAEMLRQVLENLVTYSFQQEKLMEEFESINSKSPDFAEKLRYQNTLRENFEHVDDSLFALATRNPMISEKVTKKLTDIKYNIDKALERLAQTDMRKGISSQQYAFTGANDLANMLNQSLNQMQSMMSMKGSSGTGKGKKGKKGGKQGRGFQLPDIIKKQSELSQQAGKGKKNGKKPGRKKGNSGSKGKKGKKSGQAQGGQNSQEGKKGQQPGKTGKPGSQGEKGKQGSRGEGKSEEMSGQVYEIFKRQQRLRNQLEDMLENAGLKGKQRRLLQDMEQVEQDLLRYGITEKTQDQMLRVRQQLMKLENASMKQGKKKERKSKTNNEEYRNETELDLEKAKEYFKTTEILNRKQLPLRPKYKIKVEEYFKGND